MPLFPALVVLLLLPASGFSKTSSGTAISGKLAYTKISFSYELFALSPFQVDAVPLSTSSAPSRRPVASPDGSQIAFMSTRGGDGIWNIYLAAANGTNVRQLGNESQLGSYAPRWSPDGAKIIFYTESITGDCQIRTIRADGSDERVLTSGFLDGFPDYSPDGTQIVFARLTNGNSDIWVMNADGSNPKAIVSTTARELFPAWSPDGKWIAFIRAGSRSSHDIWIARPDGSGAIDLTPDAALDNDVSWAPDSQSLLYASTSSKHVLSLFSVPVVGGKPVAIGSAESDWRSFPSRSSDGRILFDGLSDSLRTEVCFFRTPTSRERCFGQGSGPSLSPDGKSLLFVRGGGLRLVSTRSGKARVLSRAGGPVSDPTWSPDGRSIAFVAREGTKTGLFALDLRGSHKRRLLLSAAALGWPSWGNNGLIAYSDLSKRKSSIWVVKAGGGGRRKLISNGANNWQAVWSPNGRSIAFLSDRNGLQELYVRAATGRATRVLTNDEEMKNGPFWSPDGSKIGFTAIFSIWGDQLLTTVPASGGEESSVLLAIPELVDQGSWRG